MHWIGYLITIVLSTFTGWIIVWSAVKMLFYPKMPVNILGVRFQGVLPKNQPQIAQSIGKMVSKEFISFDEIEKKVTNPENLQMLKPEIEAHIDNFLRNKLKDVFPMLAMFIGDKTINQLKGAFLIELEELFPVLMKNYIGKLQQNIQVEQIITEKLSAFSLKRLEDMLYNAAGKEFKRLQFIGGAVGFIIGSIQIVVLILTR